MKAAPVHGGSDHPAPGELAESRTETSKECRTCFFTTRFPGITLEEDGRCNRCHSEVISQEARNHYSRNLDDLRAIAGEIRAEAKGPYHCVVGTSGGLDSSYVLYIARKLLGLNPLAVRYDSGLGSAAAARNFENLCRSLQVDHVVIRSRGAYDRRYVRHFLSALGRPRRAGVSAASVPMQFTPRSIGPRFARGSRPS